MSHNCANIAQIFVAAVMTTGITVSMSCRSAANSSTTATATEDTTNRPVSSQYREIKDLMGLFDYWTDPGLEGMQDRARLYRLASLVPAITRLFSIDAKVTIYEDGHPRDISEAEFAQSVGKLAFSFGPRQVILNVPQYKYRGDVTVATVEQYLLFTDDRQNTIMQYELLIQQLGGRYYITHLSVNSRLPTAHETDQAKQQAQPASTQAESK